MSADCRVNFSQALQFSQEDELKVCISSGANFLLDNLLHVGSKVWRAGILGFRELLYHTCCVCCRQQRSSDEEQRKLQLSGLVVTRACVAFARSSWDNSGCSLHTFCCWKGDFFSDTWFARGRARDQQHWWAGLVFLGHSSTKPMTPFWLLQKSQRNLFITKCE